MKKLMRALGRADDLLEVLILHVLLGGPKRRLAAASVALVTTFAFYLFSGLIFTPNVPFDWGAATSSAPYLADKGWAHPSETIWKIRKDLAIPVNQVTAVEAELAKYAAPLAGARRLLDRPAPPRFPQTPWYRDIRDLSDLLIVRGLLTASRGDGDEAMRDWIAAAKLGLVMGRGTVSRATLLEGMISTSLENSAMLAIRKHLEEGSANPYQKALIRQYLADRGLVDRSFVAYLEGERIFATRLVDHAIRHGTFCLGAETGTLTNILMPARHADRVAMNQQIKDALMGYFDTIATRARRGETRSLTPEELDRIPGLDLGGKSALQLQPLDFALSVFTPRHTATLIARGAIELAMPNLEKAAERVDQLEAETTAVRRLL